MRKISEEEGKGTSNLLLSGFDKIALYQGEQGDEEQKQGDEHGQGRHDVGEQGQGDGGDLDEVSLNSHFA